MEAALARLGTSSLACRSAWDRSAASSAGSSDGAARAESFADDGVDRLA